MSAHMKTPLTKPSDYINVMVCIPGGKRISYHVPLADKSKLNSFLKKLDIPEGEIVAWEEATPWEELAKDRIKKYKKIGLIIRGARYRENLSQMQLAKLSGIHQNEISKIENGKRGIGEKVAKKLAKPLKVNYLFLLQHSE